MRRSRAARGSVRRVHVADRQRRIAIPRTRVRTLVRRALAGVKIPGDVSVVFVNDAKMRALNRDFHGVDRTTDVLSFPLADGGLLAEIVVCTDRAAVEARRRGLPVERELLLYVVHGALHIAGYDDHAVADRRRMRERESEVLG